MTDPSSSPETVTDRNSATDGGKRPRNSATFHDVGNLEAFPVGRMVPVAIPGKDIGVLRTPAGQLHAVKTHVRTKALRLCLGATDGTFLPSSPGELTFGMQYEVIRCPNHGWEFGLETGREVFKDTHYRIVRYHVQVLDGRVLVSDRGR